MGPQKSRLKQRLTMSFPVGVLATACISPRSIKNHDFSIRICHSTVWSLQMSLKKILLISQKVLQICEVTSNIDERIKLQVSCSCIDLSKQFKTSKHHRWPINGSIPLEASLGHQQSYPPKDIRNKFVHWNYPPPRMPIFKWRFRLGFHTKNCNSPGGDQFILYYGKTTTHPLIHWSTPLFLGDKKASPKQPELGSPTNWDPSWEVHKNHLEVCLMGCLHDWFLSVCFPQQKQTCSHLQ